MSTSRPPETRRPVFHPLRVKDISQLTDDAVAITFDVPAELVEDYEFVQGQHLTVRTSLAGDDVRRSY
jgi:ring-1,2-phenylacetyl-CoA epoxidase subunit PaaE